MKPTVRLRPGARAAAALALLLAAPATPASATTGADLLKACAPGGSASATPACYGYVHAIIDDQDLVGGDLDLRFVATFGFFCTPPKTTVDDIVAAVVATIRADPSLGEHNGAIAVRLALTKVYPCSPEVLRRPAPPH